MKQKYAQGILDNVRWFAKMRHEFNFSGTSTFFLKRVHCYKRTIGEDKWSFENTISEPSFIAAFGQQVQTSKGKHSEWKCEYEAEDCIIHDVNGVNALDAFVQIDSYGVVKPTRHPTLLWHLLNVKTSINLHLKLYAESRADGTLSRVLFDEIIEQYQFLPWMIEAVENQKWNYM